MTVDVDEVNALFTAAEMADEGWEPGPQDWAEVRELFPDSEWEPGK